jgi:hypothetical protein
MDTQILSIIMIFIASLVSAGLAFWAAMFINKKKVPVEVRQIKADTDLTGGELAEKYQQIANTQADKNIALTQANNDLSAKIDALEQDMINLKQTRLDDKVEFKAALEEEKQRSIKAEDRAIKAENYIKRLLLQLSSWNIIPVPYDVEMAKDELRRSCIEGSKDGV